MQYMYGALDHVGVQESEVERGDQYSVSVYYSKGERGSEM